MSRGEIREGRTRQSGGLGGIRHWERGLADGGLEIFIAHGARSIHILATPKRDAIKLRKLWCESTGLKLPDPEVRPPRERSRQIGPATKKKDRSPA